MGRNYKERIKFRFNITQLDRTILALINNPANKRFAGNVQQLFDSFISDGFMNEYEKEYRVYLIKRVASTILSNNLMEKEQLLSFISFDGKYADDCNNLLDNLFEVDFNEIEMNLIDKQISQQLRYGIIGSKADQIADLVTAYQTDGYEDLDDFMEGFSDQINSLDKSLRLARESIAERKNDVNLSDNSFLDSLKAIINEERNPSSKVKTGIQAINTILNGGYERGRVYMACGMAKGWKSGLNFRSS